MDKALSHKDTLLVVSIMLREVLDKFELEEVTIDADKLRRRLDEANRTNMFPVKILTGTMLNADGTPTMMRVVKAQTATVRPVMSHQARRAFNFDL